jgi:hypothetical protein
MLERVPRLCRQQICRTALERDLVRGVPPLSFRRGQSAGRYVRPKLHPAGRQQRESADDVVLRSVAMPADGCARWVLVDERHRKGFRIEAGPSGDPVAERHEEPGDWRRRSASVVVRSPEEHYAPTSDDATHLEVRKLETCNFPDELRFIVGRDEVVLVVKAERKIGFEQGTARSGHSPSVACVSALKSSAVFWRRSFSPRGARYSTGLMSTTGVPSIASIGPTRSRFPSIARMTTG